MFWVFKVNCRHLRCFGCVFFGFCYFGLLGLFFSADLLDLKNILCIEIQQFFLWGIKMPTGSMNGHKNAG
jgi:hypothetical protein